MTEPPKILEDPELWVECDCGVPYVFRRAYSFSKGWMWVWQSDCKHPKKEVHAQVMMTSNGEYKPDED